MNETLYPKHNALFAANIIHNALLETKEPGYSFHPHIHEDCEFYFVTQGQCRMLIAGQQVMCGANDYVLIMPDIIHSLDITQTSPCSFYHIHFNLDFLDNPDYHIRPFFGASLPEHLTSFIYFYLHSTGSAQVRNCVKNIIYEHGQEKETSFSLANLYILELILLLSKEITHPYLSAVDNNNIYVSKAMRFIQQNYSNKILLDDIADQLAISVRYLSKIFLQKTSLTVLNYLNLYRINQAISLMKGESTLTDIAFAVGFSSLPHFSKTFFKTMAITPKEYRGYLLDSAPISRPI